MRDINLFIENAKKNRKNYKFEISQNETIDSIEEIITDVKKAKNLLPIAFNNLESDLKNRKKVSFHAIYY